MRSPTIPMAIALAALIAPPAPAQEKGAKAEINRPFEKPDVAAYVQRFETESREVFAQREAIVRALGLRPGMAVADVGAGTGLFTRLIAEKVGPEGTVYAEDVSRPFLDHVAAEAKRKGQAQVRTVLGTQEATNLAAGSVDLVFVCDVYHHFEHPGQVLASIHRALRPGGTLVVVEFDRREGVSEKFVLEHVRAGKEVFAAEIAAAGFEPVPAPDAPALKENVFLKFRKTDRPGPKRGEGRP